nr:MAG TPA: hypothetical protein [Bacteriophage sp.]
MLCIQKKRTIPYLKFFSQIYEKPLISYHF